MAEFDGAVAREFDDGEKLRKSFDIPGGIGRREMMQHEMVRIFVEQDFLRPEVKLVGLFSARQDGEGRSVGRRIEAADVGIARQFPDLGLAGQDIDLDRATLLRVGHLGDGAQQEIELFQLLREFAQLGVAAFPIDGEMLGLRLPPSRLRASRASQHQAEPGQHRPQESHHAPNPHAPASGWNKLAAKKRRNLPVTWPFRGRAAPASARRPRHSRPGCRRCAARGGRG